MKYVVANCEHHQSHIVKVMCYVKLAHRVTSLDTPAVLKANSIKLFCHPQN